MTPEPSPAPLKEWTLPILYIFARFILYLYFFPWEIGQHGDIQQYYYQWASLQGWPFINYWIEYPPVFPFLIRLIYLGVGGQTYLFYFILTFLLAAAGAGVLIVFQRAAGQLYPPAAAFQRTLVLFGVLAAFPYTWSYYDILPVLLMLAAVYALLAGQVTRTGWVLGLGMLTKWFPGFLLAAIWRYRPWRSALRITLIALGMVGGVLLALYLISPRFTTASLLVQPGRTSWETVWAMIDGNTGTGTLAQLADHYDPAAVGRLPGQPARIPTLLTLAVFGGLGLAAFARVKSFSGRSLAAFFSLTWALFLLWSPGWSPQWVLYLAPLILLTLDLDRGLFITLALLLVTVLEWPVLFTMHLNEGLWLTTILRAGILAYLGVAWYRITRGREG